MWHLGTQFSGGLCSVRLMVGLDDVRGPFQPKQFYDSVMFKKREMSFPMDAAFLACKLWQWCSSGRQEQGLLIAVASPGPS